MISAMSGWKVITKERLSFSVAARPYRGSAAAILYPVNEIATPSLPYSKLFFFKNREDAIALTSPCFLASCLVVPCIAYHCTKATYGALFFHEMAEFWKKRKNKKNLVSCRMDLPKGTWFAERIKCLA